MSGPPGSTVACGGKVMRGFPGPGKKTGFYLECDGTSLHGFEQRKLWFDFFFYSFERFIAEREHEPESASVRGFSPQMAVTARAEAGPGKEPGTTCRSPRGWQGSKCINREVD